MREQTTIRRAYVDGPDGQIHLRVAGEGGAPLLLLHQSPVSGSMFEAVMPRLAARGFHAVAMDTPGYGMSDALADGATIQGYASAIAPVMDALGWDRCHLLGHHTGAVIAANFAATTPERVDRLVLNGMALLSDEERAFFETLRIDAMEIFPDGSHLLAAWQRRISASPGWTDLAAMHRYTVEMLAIPKTYHLAFRAVFSHDVAADLRLISVPTLILTNTGEDLYESSRRAAALRTDFDYAELVGGTHDIVDEQPAGWTEIVADWLLG